MHSSFIMYILSFPYAFLPRNHGHFMNWKERKSFEERAAPWAGLRTWSAIAVVQKHSFKKEARWTQLVNAFWKKSACAWLFDTLFRTLGRLEPKWIVRCSFRGFFNEFPQLRTHRRAGGQRESAPDGLWKEAYHLEVLPKVLSHEKKTSNYPN